MKSLEDEGTFNDLTISKCMKKIKAQLSVVNNWRDVGVEPDKFDMIAANVIACAIAMSNEYRRSY